MDESPISAKLDSEQEEEEWMNELVAWIGSWRGTNFSNNINEELINININKITYYKARGLLR